MKTQDAIRHFGTRAKVARALNLSRAAVSRWEKYPPAERQMQLARLTNDALKAEPDVVAQYRALVGESQPA